MKEQDRHLIQFVDGYAWGIDIMGRTVCLGSEEDILAILNKDKKLPTNPISRQILSEERRLSRQEETKVGRRKNRKALKEQQPIKVKGVKIKRAHKLSNTIGSLCPVCKKKEARSRHHIKPISIGGENSRRNIVYLCKHCHDIVEDYGRKGKLYSPTLIQLIRLTTDLS